MNSSNSVVTPVTMANTACWDATAACIRLPAASSDAGAILEGSIIELEPPSSPPGKLLMGEIVEIVIMDENMQPLAVYNEETEGTSSAKKQTSMQRELLRMQKEQRELHEQQSQELRIKHDREKRQMDALQREGKLSSYGGAQLTAEMEDTHRREVAELRQSQQSDESELMELIAAENAEQGKLPSRNKRGGGKPGQEPQTAQAAPPPSGKAADRWSRAAVATVAGRAMNTTSQSAADKQKEPPPTQQSPKKSAANLWNRAAVATVSAGAMKPTPNATEAREPPQQNAVDTEPPPPPPSSTATPVISNATPKPDPATQKKLHRQEIQAVMKDKTLGRDEKQRRLAEIKAKYAAPASSQSEASPEKPSTASRWNKAAVSAVTANALSNSGTKPAPTPEPGPPQDTKPSTASRWNKAAVSAVTANALSSSLTKPPPKAEPEPPQEADNPSLKGVSRWKRGAAAALSSTAFSSSYKNLKQAEGNNTPMSDFISKVKDNSPSLTTIVLDGRKNVTEDEWGRLFDALEDNCILTHLSLADCDLDDDTIVPLALALVENETLVSLNLSDNPELTSSTGKSLVKVLRQSNPIMKEVKIDGTGISSKVAKKLQDILDDRDDTKRLEKLQAQRQMKIKALLAFSASDEATPSAQRLSQKMLEVEKEGDDDVDASGHVSTGHSLRSGSTGSSKDKSKKKTPKKKRRPTVDESLPGSVGGTKHSSGSGGATRRSSTHRGSNRSSVVSSHTSGSGSAAAAKFRRAARATGTASSMTNSRSMTTNRKVAQQMANLSADVLSGKSMEELRAARKMRGECEDCGQKCFTKTMFKTIPLTVPDKVHEGRCLQCAPFSEAVGTRRNSQ